MILTSSRALFWGAGGVSAERAGRADASLAPGLVVDFTELSIFKIITPVIVGCDMVRMQSDLMY